MSLIQVTLLLILLYNFFLCFSCMPGPFMLRRLKTYKRSPSKMKLRHPASWTQKRETTSKPSLVHIFFFFFFFFSSCSVYYRYIYITYILQIKNMKLLRVGAPSIQTSLKLILADKKKKNKII